MKIGNKNIDENVFIIAEIGNNHEGSYSLAEEMISLAAQSGADAVKFQTIIPEKLVSSTDKARITQLKKFQFTYNEFEKLSKHAEKENIIFLSTPFDLESVDFLNQIIPAFKIASSDNTFYPLLERIALTGKPIIMSTGLAEIDEIAKSIDLIETAWNNNNCQSDLALLHCITNYPVPPEEANLLSINLLKEKFNCIVGYSDHTLGIDASIMAVALGARIVEKHFTIDHNYSGFRDHQLSANPTEMKELVGKIRLAEKFLGKGTKEIGESERKNLVVRRSIASKRHIKTGDIITEDDITWLRPGTGIPVGKEKEIIGKKAKTDVLPGELITTDKLD